MHDTFPDSDKTMIYLIDGNEVNQAKAKAYFFEGHRLTAEWLAKKGAPAMDSAASLWKCRADLAAQDQIFNISGFLPDGGLEIVNNQA